MTFIIFAILALATWRISHLISREDGPVEFLAKFRYWVGVRYESTPPYGMYGMNEFAKMIICPWCNSVWIGLSCTILYRIWKPVWWLALPFALSAVTILIESALEKNGSS